MVELEFELATIFLQPLGRLLIYLCVSVGKLGIVAVGKPLLIFMFESSGCKKIASSPNSNSAEKLYL